MPGARTGNDDLRPGRVTVDPEVFVWRIGVKTNRGRTQGPIRVRQKTAHDPAHDFHFFRGNVATNFLRRRPLAIMMAGDFNAVAQIGESVEKMAPVNLPEMNRTAIRPERVRGRFGLE